MSDLPTKDDFDKQLNRMVRVSAAGIAIECELIECTRILKSQELEEGQRVPFSIVFRGPKEPLLEQQICRVEGDGLGALDIFLVPLGPDKSGMRYEAVFT